MLKCSWNAPTGDWDLGLNPVVIVPLSFLSLSFETGSECVAKAGLELII